MTLFRKAERFQRYMRFALYAGSGHGKTGSGLRFGTKIAELSGGRLAVVDTEEGSSSLYATKPGEEPQNDNEFDFDMHEIESPFVCTKLIEAIRDAEESPDHTALLIDSMSHFWGRDGGVLWQADMMQKSSNMNGFQAIALAKQQHYYPLVEAIIEAKIHIIITLRAKNEYDVSKDSRGKTQITRLGSAPRMEEGFIYEMDLVTTLSDGVVMRVDKTRYAELADDITQKPTGDWIVPFYNWLSGDDAQESPYKYADGSDVASTAAKRIFNEYRDAHDGEVPESGEALKAWYAANS